MVGLSDFNFSRHGLLVMEILSWRLCQQRMFMIIVHTYLCSQLPTINLAVIKGYYIKTPLPLLILKLFLAENTADVHFAPVKETVMNFE